MRRATVEIGDESFDVSYELDAGQGSLSGKQLVMLGILAHATQEGVLRPKSGDPINITILGGTLVDGYPSIVRFLVNKA